VNVSIFTVARTNRASRSRGEIVDRQIGEEFPADRFLPPAAALVNVQDCQGEGRYRFSLPIGGERSSDKAHLHLDLLNVTLVIEDFDFMRARIGHVRFLGDRRASGAGHAMTQVGPESGSCFLAHRTFVDVAFASPICTQRDGSTNVEDCSVLQPAKTLLLFDGDPVGLIFSSARWFL